MRQLQKYWHVWYITASNAFQMTFVHRGSNLLFLTGKIVRFVITLLFLGVIKKNVATFQGYTTDQLVVFFLTYSIVDQIAQTLYRGVYLFSMLVRDGSFDFYLSKPISPLFRALTGRPDINDAVFLIPTLMVTWIMVSQLSLSITPWTLLLYIILVCNALVIATALHICVLVFGILTTEVDGLIWFYRDISQFGRFPITIYQEPIRLALFFIIPIGMMITIPTEVLIQAPPSYSILAALSMGVLSILVSALLWKWGLRKYSSASS